MYINGGHGKQRRKISVEFEMSRKPDKATKRKAKQKARKIHAEQRRLHQTGRIADALMELCADVLPEYVDDSKGIDLVGRNILWLGDNHKDNSRAASQARFQLPAPNIFPID